MRIRNVQNECSHNIFYSILPHRTIVHFNVFPTWSQEITRLTQKIKITMAIFITITNYSANFDYSVALVLVLLVINLNLDSIHIMSKLSIKGI